MKYNATFLVLIKQKGRLVTKNKKMIKKILIGSLVLGGVFLFTAGTFAAEEIKPYEDFQSFREYREDMVENYDKSLWEERDALREAHREKRMEMRRVRMEEADCFSAEEIAERIQERRGRNSR